MGLILDLFISESLSLSSWYAYSFTWNQSFIQNDIFFWWMLSSIMSFDFFVLSSGFCSKWYPESSLLLSHCDPLVEPSLMFSHWILIVSHLSSVQNDIFVPFLESSPLLSHWIFPFLEKERRKKKFSHWILYDFSYELCSKCYFLPFGNLLFCYLIGFDVFSSGFYPNDSPLSLSLI